MFSEDGNYDSAAEEGWNEEVREAFENGKSQAGDRIKKLENDIYHMSEQAMAMNQMLDDAGAQIERLTKENRALKNHRGNLEMLVATSFLEGCRVKEKSFWGDSKSRNKMKALACDGSE